jgi:hypothetical protein
MTVRFTQQGCKVEVTNIIQPNGQWREEITLSVDPASQLALAVEENAGQNILDVRDKWREVPERARGRVRSTKYGFELIPERR